MAYPTEEEIERFRHRVRADFPRLFEAVEEQLRLVDEYLPTIPRKHATKYDLALTAHLARSTKTTLGIIALCENGFGELAMSSLRNLGEAKQKVRDAVMAAADKRRGVDQLRPTPFTSAGSSFTVRAFSRRHRHRHDHENGRARARRALPNGSMS